MKRIAPFPAGVNLQPPPDKKAASGIAGGSPRGGKRLFMSHPPLAEGIAAPGLAGRRG